MNKVLEYLLRPRRLCREVRAALHRAEAARRRLDAALDRLEAARGAPARPPP